MIQLMKSLLGALKGNILRPTRTRCHAFMTENLQSIVIEIRALDVVGSRTSVDALGSRLRLPHMKLIVEREILHHGIAVLL